MRYTSQRYTDDITRMTREDSEFFRVFTQVQVTLADLIRDGPHARGKLGTPWLDYSILRDRLRAAIDWVCKLDWQPRRIPNFFFQGSDDEVDAAHFAFLKAEWSKRTWTKNNARKLGFLQGVPPEVHYLHTGVNWTPNLDFGGLRGMGNWSIPPLRHYSSSIPAFDHQPKPRHLTLGYQVPDLPTLLLVSDAVATEYVARVLVHDLLHYLLPQIDANEPIHNATCIVAGEAFGDRPVANGAWEAFVLDECTDPCFSLELDRRAAGVRQLEGLTPLQRWYVDSFFQTSLSSNAPARVRELYGVTEDTPADTAREIVIARALREQKERWPSWVTPKSKMKK